MVSELPTITLKAIGIVRNAVRERLGNILRVKGLDALDGTPVIDIKPYMPPFGPGVDVKVPWWIGNQ